MFRTFRWSGALVMALALFPAVVSAAPTAGRDKDKGDGEVGAQPFDRGVFAEHCRLSHSAPDDPIVFPGQAGASHLHDFFGNTTTNAASTFDSLRAGSTTCRTGGDAAGYWVPTLSQNGTVVKPRAITVYYRSGPRSEDETITAFPSGFRVVAGDAKASSPQNQMASWWSCRGEMNPSLTPLACDGDSPLNLHVRFPQCWDGANLDSADHKSHMAFLARGGDCPSSHPVRVPSLTLIVHYPITGDPSGIQLSSGGVFSGHADFFNAWDQKALETRVSECLNAHIRCDQQDQPKV